MQIQSVFSGSEVGQLFQTKIDFGDFKMKTKKKKELKCRVCSKDFNSKMKLRKHMSTHIKISIVQKSKKNQIMENSADEENLLEMEPLEEMIELENHLEDESEENSEESGPFYCNICFGAFKNVKSLHYHQFVHTEKRNYPCPICDKSFKMKKYLNSHLIFHSEERKHVCLTCNASFKWKQGLSIHIKKLHIAKD